MRFLQLWHVALSCLVVLAASSIAHATDINLADAVVVTRAGQLSNAETTATTVLVEEIEKRTHLHLGRQTKWPKDRVVIAVTSEFGESAWGGTSIPSTPGLRAEGYRVVVMNSPGRRAIVWIIGANPRGVLYGVGAFLRAVDWSNKSLGIDATFDATSSPEYAIRGHQIGYRPQANSYDTWSVAQYEQYIRELTFFGANSIESIPFPESPPNSYMKVSEREMNRALSEICLRYGLDYWAWMPVPFDLRDSSRRDAELARDEEFFREAATLAAVFIPSGDPGKNSPELLLRFAEDVARRLAASHPQAKVWLSLQGLNAQQDDVVYAYIARQRPTWLGGLVAGPSGPQPAEMRARLPRSYRLRLYPDITHSKLAEFEPPQWDQAFALTEGRQSIDPRPVEFAAIHGRFSSYSDGTISYSDGAHDDVNKVVWSALDWNSRLTVREILIEYARAFLSSRDAQKIADGILALEANWRGPLMTNGTVEPTLDYWQELDRRHPELGSNWRWQLCLLRAHFDAYVQERLMRETALEAQADRALIQAPKVGSTRAMAEAQRILAVTDGQPTNARLRKRIEELCDELFRSIGLQTSVAKYGATNPQRGAVLDFVDLPLNNRWWLEDEFAKVARDGYEDDRIHRLIEIAKWEDTGSGDFYDAVGDLNKSPHVIRCGAPLETGTDPVCATPTFWWWNNGRSRSRLATQATMWPAAVVYDGLDPNAQYTVRLGGAGEALLKINGVAVVHRTTEKSTDEFHEYTVPKALSATKKLTLTFELRTEDKAAGWHDRARLAEVWLLRSATDAR